MSFSSESLHKNLKNIFGFNSFKGRQEKIIKNLLEEKVGGDIYVVGNTVLDNLVDIETSYSNNVIVTMHRRENHFQIKEYFEVINKLAGDNKHLNFILPIHPNPNVYRHKDILKNIEVKDKNIISLMRYYELIKELKDVTKFNANFNSSCSCFNFFRKRKNIKFYG